MNTNTKIEFFTDNGKVFFLKDGQKHPFNELACRDAKFLRDELDTCVAILNTINEMPDPVQQLAEFIRFRLRCKKVHQEMYGTLTARESEIQRLIPGHTDKEIAQILNISPNTVITHQSHIREKYGEHTRTAIIG